MKIKGLKKGVFSLVATIMVMSSALTSVGAEGNIKNAEVAFSLKYLDSLPKSGDLSEFTKTINFKESELYLYDSYELKVDREEIIKHKGKPSEKVKIDEKDAYNELYLIVQSLITKVDERTLGHANYLGKPSNDLDKPRNWRVAKAIYDWVVHNIKYDYESVYTGGNGEESFRKPQDALFVYKHKMGVCSGKANLVSLMMRMAGIPCVVIGSKKHAYNAIYLSSDNVNRNGWTIIDTTWTALESDIGYFATAGNLIEGRVDSYKGWVKDTFNRDNEYAKAVEQLTTISDNMEKNKKAVNEFNAKIARELLELNKKFDSDFKFTNINVVCFFGKIFQFKYKTDLDRDKAEDINNELKEKAKNRKIEGYISSSFPFDDNRKLRFFDEWYLKLNEHKGKSNDKSKEYIEKLNGIFSETLNQYKINKTEKNIEKINQVINSKIEKLNTDFKDIVTIESGKLEETYVEDKEHDKAVVPWIYLKSSLTFDDAMEIFDSPNMKNNKEYFPAFYNYELSFEDINKNMIQKADHDIKLIYHGQIHHFHNRPFNLVKFFDLTIKGIVYKWSICKENEKPYIYVFGSDTNSNKAQENVELVSDIANLGVPLKIRKGIKSLKLTGDQVVDISEAYDLDSVDVSESNKYEGYDVKNRKLINKLESSGQLAKDKNLEKSQEKNSLSSDLHNQFVTKYNKLVESMFDFKKTKGMDICQVGGGDVIRKCFVACHAAQKSDSSFDKVKEAEKLIDSAIEYINQCKQKFNSNN